MPWPSIRAAHGTDAFRVRLKGRFVNTIPNYITLLRLFMIPVFCYLVYIYDGEQELIRYAAFVVYVVAALTDIVDGYIARRFSQSSRMGLVLDPLADKLMVNLGFVFLAANLNFALGIPLWFPPIILARDIIIVMGAYVINEYYGPVKVKPRILGKMNTTCLVATFIGVLLQVPFAPALIWLTLLVA